MSGREQSGVGACRRQLGWRWGHGCGEHSTDHGGMPWRRWACAQGLWGPVTTGKAERCQDPQAWLRASPAVWPSHALTCLGLSACETKKKAPAP